MAWARSSARWFADDRTPPVPQGLDLDDVRGACDVATLMPMLYLMARYAWGFQPEHPPVFVEVGTDDGSTCLPLLKAAAEVGGHVHSVDLMPCPRAHELVDGLGLRGHWTHHQKPSDDFFASFRQPIDFAFMDGDHRWPVVERDVRACWELLRPGGVIWLSDYDPLWRGQESFEHEAPTADAYEAHKAGSIDDERASRGVAKALYRCLRELPGATAMQLPLWPNNSILVRKLRPSEIDPLTRASIG